MNSEIEKRIEQIDQGIVPEGYKKTKLGIIPEDWEVKKFEEEFEVNQGLQIPIIDRHKVKTKDSYVYITNEYINNLNNANYNRQYIKTPSSNVICDKKDILMTRTGNTGIVISKVEGVFHNNFFKIKYDEDENFQDFLIYLLKSKFIQHKILGLAGIGTIPDLTHSDFYSIESAFPPLNEQEKIADILSLWDEAIETTEKLIKEKEIQKKGLMQKLIREEIKLKDKHGNEYPDWEEKKIEDIFEKVTRGNVLATSKTKKNKDEVYLYPVYSSQTLNNGLMGYYNEYLFEDAITWTTDGANAGTVKYRKNKFYCTNVCGVLLSGDEISNKCIAEILNRVAWKHVSHVGNPKLMNNVMAEIKIKVPVSSQEQKSIANILSDADKEIELLNQLLSSKKQEKKGLMQVLLTGIARV